VIGFCSRGACAIYCWRPASMIFWQSNLSIDFGANQKQ
jgi:hypothetical protein